MNPFEQSRSNELRLRKSKNAGLQNASDCDIKRTEIRHEQVSLVPQV